MNNKAIFLGVVLLIGAAAGLQWYHTRGPSQSGALQRAADKINLTMPKPYVNGLVMEKVHVVDKRLVTDIHIPDIRLGDLDAKKIPMIHKQEQGDLVEAACSDPELLAVMQNDAQVARRFLDQDHKLIFEIAVSKTDCPARAIE